MNEDEYKTFSIWSFPESVHQLVRLRAVERKMTIREYIIDVVVQEARKAHGKPEGGES